MSDDDIELDASSAAQRRTLLQVFLLNAGLSTALFITGGIANSAALIANGADNASDAVVYALSFFAATHGARWKVRAARLSGVALLVVSAGVFIEALRRFFGDPEPAAPLIIGMSIVAAAVNILCLRLLLAHRRSDVNLRAAWTFSINDMLSNLGALAAGVLVPVNFRLHVFFESEAQAFREIRGHAFVHDHGRDANDADAHTVDSLDD